MKNLLSILGVELKASWRSPIWHRKMFINLFLLLTFFYLAGNLVLLGVLLDDILIKLPIDGIDYKSFGSSFVLRKLNRFLMYYFFFDFIIRYFMQKLPAMVVQPYLHLPIQKSSLVNYLLLKTIWSPFNILHFLIFVPFFFEVFENLEFFSALGWVLAFVTLVFTSNYFLLLIKRTSDIDTRVYLGMLGIVTFVVAADWFGWIDFQLFSAFVFNAFFLHPFLALIPVLLLGLVYGVNYRYLRANMYLSRLAKDKRSEVSYVGNGLLSRFGLIGRLAELEFKFIWRNKRPKSVLLMTILFLAYGLIVFPNPEYDGNYLMYTIFSIIITGMFLMNYGQYLLGWEGSHFDHILTRNVSFYDYYMSKFLLFAMVSAAAMILSIPYVYFGSEILLVVFCLFLFNLGINSHIIMFFGSLNPKKIDLSQGT
ncbi:MAG: DUF5687 family protein, partial [Salibacteraceae bacterium]